MQRALEQRQRHVDRSEEEEEKHRHLHQGPRLHRAQPHRNPGRPQEAADVDDQRERVEPDHVDETAANLHPGDKGDHGQKRRGDTPAQHRGKGVPEHDARPVRRGEHQPASEAALEVPSDPEAREDTAECRRLEQDEHELERRVATRVVEARHVLHLRQPTREGDEEEEREHQRRQKERRGCDHVLQRPPRDTGGNGPESHVRSILCPRAQLAATSETTATTVAKPKPSASALASQPVMMRLRTHSIR